MAKSNSGVNMEFGDQHTGRRIAQPVEVQQSAILIEPETYFEYRALCTQRESVDQQFSFNNYIYLANIVTHTC